MTRRGSAALLAAAYLAAVGLCAVAAAHDTKTGASTGRAGAAAEVQADGQTGARGLDTTAGGPFGQRGDLGSQDEARPEKARRSPSQYWILERRYVDQQHAMGRLGAEVRRLRRQAAGRRLESVHASPGYAIRLAASTFGVSEPDMRSVASCETAHFTDFYNEGSGASGLFQFLSGTWASQGLARFSVFDPVANALAAARIVSREGWRQWQCRP